MGLFSGILGAVTQSKQNRAGRKREDELAARSRKDYITFRDDDRRYAERITAKDREYAERLLLDDRDFQKSLIHASNKNEAARLANERNYLDRQKASDRAYLDEKRDEDIKQYTSDRADLQRYSNKLAERSAASRGIDFVKLRDDAVKAGYNRSLLCRWLMLIQLISTISFKVASILPVPPILPLAALIMRLPLALVAVVVVLVRAVCPYRPMSPPVAVFPSPVLAIRRRIAPRSPLVHLSRMLSTAKSIHSSTAMKARINSLRLCGMPWAKKPFWMPKGIKSFPVISARVSPLLNLSGLPQPSLFRLCERIRKLRSRLLIPWFHLRVKRLAGAVVTLSQRADRLTFLDTRNAMAIFPARLLGLMPLSTILARQPVAVSPLVRRPATISTVE